MPFYQLCCQNFACKEIQLKDHNTFYKGYLFCVIIKHKDFLYSFVFIFFSEVTSCYISDSPVNVKYDFIIDIYDMLYVVA